MLALDMDGTLLDKEHTLKEETAWVIKKIKNMGIEVIIATGRMYISILPFLKTLGLSGPMIAYNGSYIRNNATDEVLYHKTVDREITFEIINKAEENDLHIQLYYNDDLYVKNRNEIVKRYEKISGVEAICMKKLTEVAGPPTKILIIEDNREKFLYFYKKFKARYGGKIEITESFKNFMELGAKGVTKGRALEFLAEKFRFKREEIISAGDGKNDYEMIRWAGTGIAMHDAPEKVKKYANIIAPPEVEGGLCRVLKEIFNL